MPPCPGGWAAGPSFQVDPEVGSPVVGATSSDGQGVVTPALPGVRRREDRWSGPQGWAQPGMDGVACPPGEPPCTTWGSVAASPWPRLVGAFLPSDLPTLQRRVQVTAWTSAPLSSSRGSRALCSLAALAAALTWLWPQDGVAPCSPLSPMRPGAPLGLGCCPLPPSSVLLRSSGVSASCHCPGWGRPSGRPKLGVECEFTVNSSPRLNCLRVSNLPSDNPSVWLLHPSRKGTRSLTLCSPCSLWVLLERTKGPGSPPQSLPSC